MRLVLALKTDREDEGKAVGGVSDAGTLPQRRTEARVQAIN
jgi:hypothetical protein